MQGSERFQTGKLIPLFLAFVFIAPGCSEKAPPPASAQSVSKQTVARQTASQPAVPLPTLEPEGFGALPAANSVVVTPSLKDQTLSVDRAVNFRRVMTFLKVRLTQGQKNFLNEHRFLLIPKSATRFKGRVDLGGEGSQFDEMLGLFDELIGSEDPIERKPENCRFVNPDVMLHAFHKYLENSLEYLEKTELAGTLKHFLTALQAEAMKYRAEASGPLADHYELIAAQLTVPLVILENAHWQSAEELEEIALKPPEAPVTDDGDTLPHAVEILSRFKEKFTEPVFNRMAAELRLIYEAGDLARSPLYGQYAKDEEVKADYTQFTPRSHYVKSSVLRSYFRVMMYLGRNSYLLEKNEGVSDALLTTLLMAGSDPDGLPILKDWQKIMDITGFYAGRSDDIAYPEWRDFLVKVLESEKFSAEEAVDPAILTKISGRLGELRAPRILSEIIEDPGVIASTKEQLLESSKGFRIFGQRFSFDAWMLSRLTAGREQTRMRLPSMPSALFVSAALGDKAARGFADQYLQQLPSPFSPEDTARFNDRMDEVSGDLGKVKDTEWFSCLGAAWLKVLGALTSSYGPGYPLYMQDRLFPVKQVESFLGSYTELKHDTLLYAKQNYAEMGGGGGEGTPPPAPKGFVEPNLPFWENLERLVAYVEAGYTKYGLFKNDLEEFGTLNRFKGAVEFYSSLAEKELQGVRLSPEEYERLRTEPITYMAEPRDANVYLEDKDRRAGLIADLHTDSLQRQVLYEATGEPYIMLVLTGNEGTLRLAVGAAFNHYEFTGPLTTRYNDADWQSRVYEHASGLPEKSFWYKNLMSE